MNKMKRQLILSGCREKQLNKGDKVKLIDGSSITSKELPDEEVYIVFSFNGRLSKNIKELECTVVETNLEGRFCEGVLDHIYKQDILVEVEGYHFYTSSSMVEII